MSETLYWSQQTEAFLSAHPYEEGWKVYTYRDEAADRLFLRYLPDFMRDCCSGAITRRELSRVLDVDDLMGTDGQGRGAQAGSEWDLEKELNGTSWKGRIPCGR